MECLQAPRAEVDFIARLPDGTHLLVQICETLTDPPTRKREIGALREAMEKQGVSRGLVVTRAQEERVDTDVIPAWRFLLELPA